METPFAYQISKIDKALTCSFCEEFSGKAKVSACCHDLFCTSCIEEMHEDIKICQKCRSKLIFKEDHFVNKLCATFNEMIVDHHTKLSKIEIPNRG